MEDSLMAVLSAPRSTIAIHPGYLHMKRIVDVVATLLLAIPLCIVFVLVAVVIRLDSQGPVLFRQKRVGLNGEEFLLFKFRSMYVDTDESVHRNAITHYMNGAQLHERVDTANLYKLVDDPRITRIGRILRKTSIDELPQFLNVLRGEMTLVGPRPPLPYEVELYSDRDWLRLCGKPGLTGIWQVYARSRVDFQTMVDMDIDYLRHQSVWEDLKLVVLTPWVMISGRGGA
jgi:lipopolysaccharide/colanic/teichoic acid biosynthesis glycosyltransferase